MAVHYKSMMDKAYLYAFDLGGKDVSLKIERVVAGELTSQGGRKTKKPLVYFAGQPKPLALNSTNAKTIATLFGNYVEQWVGKSIVLYPTTCEMNGETVEAIRIRPVAPKEQK